MNDSSNNSVQVVDSSEVASPNSDLLGYYRSQHGIDIKIRSASPAIEQLLEDSKLSTAQALDATYDRSYDKGDSSYDKIYQTYDKS